MLEKVEEFCEEYDLLRAHDTILAACSGGPDSLVLLELLMRLREKYKFNLLAAHFNHKLRGEAANGDACFVEAFCRQREIFCYQGEGNVAAYAKEQGLSLEEAARILRYAFLRETLRALGGGRIATGHHKDDQAETVLLHLFRGAGSAGIAGIRPLSRDIIRPLLSVTRREIEAFCKQAGFLPRLDASNLEPVYTRNRIRLELLPGLAAVYNPSITEALCRTADLIGVEHDFFQSHIKELYDQNVCIKNGQYQLDGDVFLKLHKAQQRALVREIIEHAQGHVRGISLEHIDACIKLAKEGRQDAKFLFPGGFCMRKRYGRLEFFPAQLLQQSALQSPDCQKWELVLPGNTIVPYFSISIEGEIRDKWPEKEKLMAVFDANKVRLPLIVRSRLPGDRFLPFGMKGAKKIKDFLIEHKVERERRDQVPLICDREGILWVVGYRQSETAKVTDETTKYLLLRIIRR